MPLEAIYGLIEASPLWVILLTFLSDAEHGGEKYSVRRCLRICDIEKGYTVLLDASLGPLQPLIRLSGLFLEHLIKLFTIGLRLNLGPDH